jgi:pimeloyl-ACP methyl ester carboxylesterase
MLVLLPGLDGTGKLLTTFVQALAQVLCAPWETQVIAYLKDEPLGYDELERRVRGALPDDRPFVLLAESFSGPIAIRIAASPPRAMRGVILCGTFARNPYPLLGWAGPLAFLVPTKSLPRWVRAPLLWGSKNAVRVPVQAERAIAQVADAVVRRRIRALLEVDAGECLRRITLPVLILRARDDRIVPRAASLWMSERLAAAHVAVIDGPHLLLQAAPQECAAAVGQWLLRQPGFT